MFIIFTSPKAVLLIPGFVWVSKKTDMYVYRNMLLQLSHSHLCCLLSRKRWHIRKIKIKIFKYMDGTVIWYDIKWRRRIWFELITVDRLCCQSLNYASVVLVTQLVCTPSLDWRHNFQFYFHNTGYMYWSSLVLIYHSKICTDRRYYLLFK